MTRREILEAVAAGRLSAEEAAALLDASDLGVGDAAVVLRRVRVRAATRTVRVVGDEGVSEVAVEGLHEVRREGDTLVVAAHPGEGAGGFAFVAPDLGRLVAEGRVKARQAAHAAAREAARVAYAAGRPAWAPPPASRGRYRKDWREWMPGPDWPGSARPESGWPDWREFQGWVEPLVVRMNPRLALDAEVSAGALEVSGVRGPIGVEVAFASATLDGVAGPVDVRAQAATVRISGAIRQGSSRVRGDAASLSVRLAPGSDVRVRASCELGRLRILRGEIVSEPGEELVVGAGRASLDIEASMGSVEVRAPEGVRH